MSLTNELLYRYKRVYFSNNYENECLLFPLKNIYMKNKIVYVDYIMYIIKVRYKEFNLN